MNLENSILSILGIFTWWVTFLIFWLLWICNFFLNWMSSNYSGFCYSSQTRRLLSYKNCRDEPLSTAIVPKAFWFWKIMTFKKIPAAISGNPSKLVILSLILLALLKYFSVHDYSKCQGRTLWIYPYHREVQHGLHNYSESYKEAFNVAQNSAEFSRTTSKIKQCITLKKDPLRGL